ncbi:MAG: hypothetical protein JO021_15930 [Alphaproteobacteria bacterium]|jgi:hypothetical protein|nr:hypothetical protein [Alphaproteobacteria bacterium]
MPRRTTPRPPEEARAIVRALRKRYITPEAEAAAKAAFEKLGVPFPMPSAPAPAPAAPEEPTLLQLIRDREGIAANAPLTELPAHETAAEKLQNRARTILARIQSRFNTKQ